MNDDPLLIIQEALYCGNYCNLTQADKDYHSVMADYSYPVRIVELLDYSYDPSQVNVAAIVELSDGVVTALAMNLPELLNNGKLPSSAFPGNYPFIYFDKQNSCLCAECATESLNDEVEAFKTRSHNIHWEGTPLQCDRCGTGIESAYGYPKIT